MKKVLVTTDLSANSKAGIRFAIQLQKQTGCSLVFYHAIEIMKPTSWNDVRYKRFADEKNAEFIEKLIGFVAKVYSGAGTEHGNCSYKTEIGTRVADMTVAFAGKVRADMICLGTRGGGKIQKLLGSVATSLLVTSPLPVTVVPSRYSIGKIDHVWYATDLEVFAPELKKVKTFADEMKARITVVNYDFMLMDKKRAETRLAKYGKFESAQVKLSLRKRDSDASVAECLRRDLKKEKPSVVVLFTKLSKGWFNRLFKASRTEQLALHPTVPLLVFRKKPAV